jgi:peptidoglycan/LPS O-acetylase OafA/YrhL
MAATDQVTTERESSVPASSSSTRLRHMPALDGIRGAAVAGVLLFHADHLEGGYLGVDLFFVLSGFLITSLLLVEPERTGGLSLSRFWARRARRLLPALAGVLLAVAAYAWLFASPEELARIRGDSLATLGYVANWRYVFADQSYWDLFLAPSPLQHTWSVAIEEQFYVLWPLVVLGLLRWRGRQRLAASVLAVAAGLAVVSEVLLAVLGDGDHDRAYFGTDTRAASILLGAGLAAVLSLRGPARTRRSRQALELAAVAGVGVLALAWLHLNGQSDTLYRGGLLLCALAGVAVIAAAAHPDAGPVARVLSFPPLRALGLISYGVYLWHWPVFVTMTEDRTGFGGWPLLVAKIALTLVIATASYRWLEQPIRHGALRAPQLRVIVPATTVLLVVAIVASTVGARSPAAVASDADLRDSDAEVGSIASGTPPGAERLLVLGNSVGLFLGEAFKALDADPPVTAVNRSKAGCIFPDAEDTRQPDGSPLPDAVPCTPGWREDIEAVEPDVVLLALSAPVLGAESRHDGAWVAPCTPAYDRWYADALRQLAREVEAAGARLVVAGPAYSQIIGTTEAALDQADCLNRVDREVADTDPTVEFVDLGGWTCPTRDTCRQEVDGVTLRPDGLHFRDEGGVVAARWLLEQIRS